MDPVAVIDIGSNSIKILIAEGDDTGGIRTLESETIEARISEGINRDQPVLSDEGMRRGVSAVRELFTLTIPYDQIQIRIVATSAVRDAGNAAVFQKAVEEASGHSIQILSGKEEANLIGRGVTCDSALRDLRDFHLFDLGGGSLECLQFKDRMITQANSLQLGCVRLTEKFISDRNAPIAPATLQSVYDYSLSILQQSDYSPESAPVAVGTGGTLATVRAIIAEQAGLSFEASSPLLELDTLRQLRDQLAALTLESRRRIEGLPESRADVFPAALTTLIALADHGGFSRFHHSLCNLRYGVAAEMLDQAK